MSEYRFVGPLDRMLYLKTLPALGTMPTDELALMARRASERHFSRGEVIYERGRFIEHFYVIVSGSVRVDFGGRTAINCGPNDNVGLVAALAGASDIEAVAEVDTIALQFSVRRLIDILEDHFSILQTTIQNLASYQNLLLPKLISGTRRAPWVDPPAIPTDRELDVIERIGVLRRGAIFENLGLEAMVLMAMSMKQERWSAGTQLWKVGDESGHLHFILQGTVDCELEGDAGKFEAGPGYPLGNLESLAQQPRWYVPVARTELVTLRANYEAFFDVMEDDFEVAEIFLRAMGKGILASILALADRGIDVSPMALELRTR